MKTIKNRIARTLVLVVSLILSFPVFGQDADAVDLNLASRVGANFIKLNPDIKLSGEPGSLKRVETDKFPNLYIFNADDHGFIIVAGDKRVQPILGFSIEGTFDPNDMAPAAEMIIGGYDYVVDSIVHYNARATDESVAQAWRDLERGYYESNDKGNRDNFQPQYPLAISPLIKTNWGQGNLTTWSGNYNKYCPEYDYYPSPNNHIIYKALTGCGPTAMAQLLYHYKAKVLDTAIFRKVDNDYRLYAGHLIHSGNVQLCSQGYNLQTNEEEWIYSTYSAQSDLWGFGGIWQQGSPILFRIKEWNYKNMGEKEVAARMMHFCGLATSATYKIEKTWNTNVQQYVISGETGAYRDNTVESFKNDFGYKDTYYRDKAEVPSQGAWYDTLRKHISNKNPLFYYGEDNDGKRHAFIIDGYDETGFHINFGWNGDNNANYWLIEDDTRFFKNQGFISLRRVKDKCNKDIDCLHASSKELKDNQATNQMIYESLVKYDEYTNAMSKFLSNAIKEIYWQDEVKGIEFWNLFQSLLDNNTGMISEAGIQQLINQNQIDNIPEDYIEIIAERYNQSVLYWNEGFYTNESLPEGFGDVIEYDTAAMRKAYEAQAYAESLGFSDVRQMYDNAYEMLEAEVRNQQTSVCASVAMQFSHKASMTREAFNGTLQIFNGHESIPMQNILVDFRIEDQQGNDCTNLFQINTLSLESVTGISGDGSLAAQTNGTALVQFIPTRNAAPTEPVVYSFGGSFSFIDPFTGDGLTYPLHPVDITVNPSPDLHIDYFMQRDILGDDALTTNVVEQSVPTELAAIINNKGAGIAKNVILETAEPQIVDNEKGLAISFKMCGSYLNGIERQLGLHGIPFGNIEGGQKVVGEWLFTSSLLGHFISYKANVVHNSSYGNQKLSLISHIELHELIHPIYAYGNLDDGINDFLVNDNPDAYDTPDSICFSHGGKTSVGVADDISFDHYVSPSDTIVTLTVEPSRIGWNYGVTDDPGMNQYDIVSCIRNNDNQVIPLNNVWLTFVTIPDGGDPVYENKLHIVDTIPVQQTTTYTLVFTKKPSNLRIFHGDEDEYWSNAANWEGYIMPQADDEVLIDGICQLDEDAEVFSLTVAENQSLTIPEDRILTVSGSLTNANASGLVVEEGGQLMHTNAGAQGTVQKNIMPYTAGTRDGWYLVAPPLVGNTAVTSVTDMLYNNYDLYYYDEPTHYWINQKDASNHFEELTNGKSYLYANNEEVMLGFEGELQSGSATITVLLNYTDDIDLAGFNLVGNPYAHNVTSYASVNVANGCFQINETKDDFIVSEISEANPLKPAEGFFVKATGEGASVTFNPGRGETANHNGSIYVELLYDGKLIDRLIVKSEGDPLRKFSLNNSRAKVFAMLDHREVAIVPCEGNEQPVNFKAARNGTFTINVNTKGMEFNYLHLIDNLTGADVDLLALRQAQGPMSYTFEAKTTDYDSRFKLVFSVSGDENDEDAPFAFINNGNIVIVGAEADATLQIVDVLGRVLVCRDASKCEAFDVVNASAISTTGMVPGVYVLRLIEGEKERTQKIVIQ